MDNGLVVLAILIVYMFFGAWLFGTIFEKLSDRFFLSLVVCGVVLFVYLLGPLWFVRWIEFHDLNKPTQEVVYGTVERYGTETSNRRTYCSISLKEKPGVVFYGDSRVSAQLPLTSVGDSVGIGCAEKGKTVIEITEFRNFTFEDKGKSSPEAAPQPTS